MSPAARTLDLLLTEHALDNGCLNCEVVTKLNTVALEREYLELAYQT